MFSTPLALSGLTRAMRLTAAKEKAQVDIGQAERWCCWWAPPQAKYVRWGGRGGRRWHLCPCWIDDTHSAPLLQMTILQPALTGAAPPELCTGRKGMA